MTDNHFYREIYHPSPYVFAPRFDTERVVDHIIRLCPRGGRILDLCCGSGCVGISSLCNTTGTTAVSADINPHAVELTLRNAERNGVAERISVYNADVFTTKWLEQPGGSFDIIASNPPYLRTADMADMPPENHAEPTTAFDGGADGLDFYRMILDTYPPFLAPGGHFVFEIGYHQGNDLRKLCAERGMTCEIHKDYGGNDRVAIGRFQ